MADDIRPDDIIEDLGGCGRYQWRLNIAFHIIKMAVTFSVMSMVLMSQTPKWSCADDCNNNMVVVLNTTKPSAEYISECQEKSCFSSNSNASCKTFKFHSESETFVTEVCDFILPFVALQSNIVSLSEHAKKC